mgnify:CR=1 FL=1
MSTAQHPTTHRFEAEVDQLLHLVIHSLYSNTDIFLRELLSNASDALDRLRFRAIAEPDLLAEGETLGIRLIPDAAAKTLTIEDNGVGMSAEELAKQLGTIAHSGTKAFLQQLKDKQASAPQLIGQFGVGFYSAYLVADRVEVTSLAAGTRQAHRWSSDARGSYTLEPATRVERGTSICLHLKESALEYLEPARLRQLVERYSDYLSHPIELVTPKASGEALSSESERLNKGRPIWQRSPKELDAEQYHEFYRHLSHDWEPPLAYRHFRIEGVQEFTGILFVPRHAPVDLLLPDSEQGIRLHVRRVFVMEDCKELLPKWLRFLRGVVDSEDLPLNVSRESLQDSAIIRAIRKQIVKQALELFAELAKERPEDYALFWKNFGAVLKEGLHFESEPKERLSELLRYPSVKTQGLVSLAAYCEAMPAEQKAIYYVLGEGDAQSPHLEIFRARGLDVLRMSDPVDPWVVEALRSYRDLPLVAVDQANLELEASASAETTAEAPSQERFQPLIEALRRTLQDHVSEVRPSKRLVDSPACLVLPEGAMPVQAERLLRAMKQEIPRSKRILELNLAHPLLERLLTTQSRGEEESFRMLSELLFYQALLAEGGEVEEPKALATQLKVALERLTAA